MSALELTELQGAALEDLDEGIRSIAAGFDRFIEGVKRCEAERVPDAIVQAKAIELQQVIAAKMTGG